MQPRQARAESRADENCTTKRLGSLLLHNHVSGKQDGILWARVVALSLYAIVRPYSKAFWVTETEVNNNLTNGG